MRQSLQLNNSSLKHNQNVSFSTLSFEKKEAVDICKGITSFVKLGKS